MTPCLRDASMAKSTFAMLIIMTLVTTRLAVPLLL